VRTATIGTGQMIAATRCVDKVAKLDDNFSKNAAAGRHFF